MHRWRALGDVHIPAPSAPAPRSVGLAVGGVLAALALFGMWRGHHVRAESLAAVGAALVVAALVRPASLARLATAWARVGHAIGWINSRILLTVLFVLLLWPIGFVSRRLGSDPLDRRRRRAGSFWTACSPRRRDPRHYERLY